MSEHKPVVVDGETWAAAQVEAVAREVAEKGKPKRKRRKVRGVFLKPGKEAGVWWIRWWCNYGHRHEERIGPRGLAEDMVEMRRVAVKTADFCLTKSREAKRKAHPTLFGTLAARYLEWANVHRPRSIKFRVTALNHLKAAFEATPLSEITPTALEAYQGQRWAVAADGTRAADGTVNRELQVLSHVFHKAIEWRLATTNPVLGVERRAEPKGRTRYLTADEEGKLLKALPTKYHAVTRLAVMTGLRMGELRALLWKDVDLGPRPVLTILRAKSQRTEHVPLNSDAVAVLRTLEHVPLNSDPERTDPRVFPALPSHLSDLFKKHAVKAKLQDVTFHTLRHTFCSRLVQAGVPLRMVQVLARHSNIEVTERYAHVGDSHTRKAVERLSEYEAEARKALEKVTQGVTEKSDTL
jgi:integrase